MDPFQTVFKTAAVGGIFMTWFKFTIEAFKFSWHIITTTPEEKTYKPVTSVMCTECRHFFPGEQEPFICFSCQGNYPTNQKKKFSSYTMSPLEFNQQVFKAFVYGGIFSAAVFTTTYLIDQLHDHHYDLKFLSDRVDRVKEKQDLNESKENTG